MLKIIVLSNTPRKGISILRYISILRRIHIPVRSANRLHKNIMLLRESLMKLNIQYKVFNTCAAIYFFIGGSTYAYIFDGPYSIFSIKYDYQKGTDTGFFFKIIFYMSLGISSEKRQEVLSDAICANSSPCSGFLIFREILGSLFLEISKTACHHDVRTSPISFLFLFFFALNIVSNLQK